MNLKIGDNIPNSKLFYIDKNNEVKNFNIKKLCEDDKTIILGMPGAFTKTCSSLHLPGFVKNYNLAKKKGVKKIICVAVNDPNVMKAWGRSQKVEDKILMCGDPFLEFTSYRTQRGRQVRKRSWNKSNRYSMLIEKEL